ncbi:hypothetical protein UlMin_016030 [Ulmus minor]
MGSSSRKTSTEASFYPHSFNFKQLFSVAAIILGDGSAESRGLYPLTKRRAEGAIPIAAKYRLIDAVVSNCINSNIHRIYALTQFNSTSLNSHFSRAYSGASALIQVIAASQSPDHNQWFQGSADAVRRCLWIVEEEGPVSEFLVLPSHHLYRMDYQKLITAHRNNKADITLAASFDRMNPDPGFGFLQLNSKNQVVEFSLKSEARGKMSDTGSNGLKSMGIYLINKDTMKKLVHEDFPNANDLKSEVIPGAVSSGMKVQGYIFGGYWEDMRSIEAFYQANMETTKSTAMGYNFFDREMAMYTLAQSLPPTLITDAVITDSLIGDGCIINRCKIKGAVIGTRSKVREGAVIEDSVILGSDSYQAEEENDEEIPIGIGKQTQIRKAIIDKNARIGNNVMIINKDKVEEGDREANGYVIRDGIVVVLRSAAIPHATII